MGKAIDLFSGAGGFSLAAGEVGYRVEHAVEVDDWACQTLARNHPETAVHCADICDLSDAWIRRNFGGDLDLLIGGPPCQGFSHAGPALKDPKDPRNSLFKEFVRVARLLAPPQVVLENVPGILRAKTDSGEPVAEIIEDELRALGYDVRRYTLNAQDFGVPQIRRRVFFVGSAGKDLPTDIPATHGDDLELLDDPILTVRDAISDLPNVDVGESLGAIQYVGPPSNAFQLEMRVGAPAELRNHLPMRHSARTVERFKKIKAGQSQSHVKDAELVPRRRVRDAESGSATYDQNNRRMYWDRPCHTLPASFYANFIHPELHRNFTPREGARIQTFPDRYVFEGKPTVVSSKLLAREGRHAERHLCQYNQIGNAVPPRFGRALLTAIAKQETSVAEEASANV